MSVHMYNCVHVLYVCHVIFSPPCPGYDTTTTSPDSARSSFSSPKEFIPRTSVLPELPSTNPDLSQLVMDPVKLIDERIKVHYFIEYTVERS